MLLAMGCLDDNTIALWADGGLSAAARAEADAHIDSCERCRELVVGMVRASDGVTGEQPTRRVRGQAPTSDAPPPSSRRPPAWSKDASIAQYRILRHLGRGGAGEVYVARDTRLGRRVALKTMRSVARSQQAAERFMREARITAKLNHPNIVTIYEVAQHEGTPFIALEYVHGRSLHERLEDAHWPSVQESVRIALAVAEALVHAHRHGVLHRDLKPGNIVIDREGRVRVVDFGLAETFDIDDPLTAEDEAPVSFRSPPNEVEGTPLYMSPEQWAGENLTAATDVWAMGVLMYLLIAHRHPFHASNVNELMGVVATEDPPPWHDDINTAPELEELVRRCLSKSPAERPTASEVLDTLRAVLSAPRHAAVSQDSPYRGLLAFRERDAGLFFGREEEIASFVERLRVHPIMPVVGPSGAGKSSFIEAGVIPRLREQRPWQVVRLRPRGDPFGALASALLRADSSAASGSDGTEVSGDSGTAAAKRELAERLATAPGELFIELLAMSRRRGAQVLLFIDQLEEAFTLVSDREVLERFVRAVLSAADDELDPVRVVFTLRDDFVVRLAELQEGRHALTQLTVMHTPSEQALAEILEGPALVVGYKFDDPELIGEMIASLHGERACLPLIEFAAQQLWEKRDKGRRLLLRSAYEELGGVAGALVRHADGVIDGLSSAELLTARQLLLRLVTADRTRRVVRASEALEGLGERGATIVERFTRARLLSVTRSKSQADEDALIELVHDSLIHRWTTLSRWIDESHDELMFLEEVSEAADIWARRGRSPQALWTGDELRDAVRRVARATTPISDNVVAFVQAAEERRQRRQRRTRLAIAALVGTLATIASIAIYVAIYVDQQRGRAERFSAQSLLEAARGAHAQGGNLEARAKLRMALEIEDSVGARALWWQLAADPLVWRKHIGAALFGVDLSPDGERVASVSQNGTVYVIDRQTRATRLLRGHRDQVIGVAFSPDGQRLASGGLDHSVRIWKLPSGAVEQVLEGHQSGVHGVAFSSDGTLVAAGGEDRSVRVWEIDTGNPRQVFRAAGVVRSVAFSPDGTWLASSGGDHDVRLWSLRDTGHKQLSGHERDVYSVAFSSDGKRLASASLDHSVRLWDVGSGKPTGVLRGLQASASGVRFSADGKHVIAGGVDGTIQLWESESGKRAGAIHERSAVWGVAVSGNMLAASTASDGVALYDLELQRRVVDDQGHGDAALSADFAVRDDVIASGGLDQTVRLWSVESGAQRVSMQLPGTVQALAMSPQRNQLAAASEGGMVRLWNLDEPAEPKLLRGHSNIVYRMRFSNDGRRLASSSFDASVRVWDTTTGDTLAVLDAGKASRVRGVAFSPAGAKIASASDDGMVRIFDIDSRSLDQELSGHEGRVYNVSFSPDGQYLASTGWDTTVRLWRLESGEGQILGRHAQRAYSVDFHPDGKRIASASADHNVIIWNIVDKTRQLLRGHKNEVNEARFSHDGKSLVSASDDGTVRLWRLDPLREGWFGAGWLGSPMQLLSHQGWRRLDDSQAVPPSGAYATMLQDSARAIAASRDGSKLCVRTHDDKLALWDVRADKQLLSHPVKGVEALVATQGGCVVLAEGKATLHSENGEQLELVSAPATAIATGGDHLLVATAGGIEELDSHGKTLQHHGAGSGVSAIWRDGDSLLAGYGDGNIERIASADSSAAPFENVPDSAVVQLLAGPQSTVIAGYANGTVVMWDATDGSELARARIHGPVSHLAVAEHHLLVASDLGRSMRWDLNSFYQDRCAMLREVWQRVPIVWENGQAKLLAPPVDHPCSSR